MLLVLLLQPLAGSSLKTGRKKLTRPALLLLARLLLLRLGHHLHARWEGVMHAGDALHVRHPQLVLLLLVPANDQPCSFAGVYKSSSATSLCNVYMNSTTPATFERVKDTCKTTC